MQPFQEPGEHDRRLTPDELDKIEMMHKYVLSNAHFYCETVDISRPFPSSNSVDQPSWEFVWNRWLSAALRAVKLPSHCPLLMQVHVSCVTCPCFPLPSLFTVVVAACLVSPMVVMLLMCAYNS